MSVNKAIKTLKAFDGIVEQASEEELSNAAALVDRTGTFNCPHTGVAIAAFLKLLERKVFNPKDRVVIISTAHGLKFVEFKVGYHQGTLEGFLPRYANAPVELPPDINAVQNAIFENVKEAVHR